MMHLKTAQNAIAAMSRLAELYGEPARSASSREIAESRNLPAPLIAKILAVLSRGGLVAGSPGPGGGYRLTRPPSQITLKDVCVLFERESEVLCAFGPGWCGNGAPCPLHDAVTQMNNLYQQFLESTSFEAFEHGVSRTRPASKTKKK